MEGIQERKLARVGREFWPEECFADAGQPVELSKSPHQRQRDFLALDCEEALFGGAAGGGKTATLMMWLAQGVHVPTYSGLFLRRTFAQLEKSNDSPIAKAYELYRPLGGQYNISKHIWTFPSGAMIEFGHMQHDKDVENYQGGGYHRTAFDELTQFTEWQYTYLFSRQRRLVDFPISLGMRASANPGGTGHRWVYERFITKEAESAIRCLDLYEPSPPGLIFWPKDGRAFVPARVADNPSLDIDDYIQRMQTNLPEVLRKQLLNGDWSVVEGALIDIKWFRRYQADGNAIWVMDGDKRAYHVDQRMCRRFATIDTAGSAKQKENERKGKQKSNSALSIWDAKGNDLFLRHVAKGRWEWPQLKAMVIHTLREWNVPRTHVENQTVGGALAQEIRAAGLAAEEINCVLPGMASTSESAKLDRAIAAGMFERLEGGNIYLPQSAPWLSDYEAEMTTWQGAEGEQSDQVDITSYACWLSRKASLPTKGLIK